MVCQKNYLFAGTGAKTFRATPLTAISPSKKWCDVYKCTMVSKIMKLSLILFMQNYVKRNFIVHA